MNPSSSTNLPDSMFTKAISCVCAAAAATVLIGSMARGLSAQIRSSRLLTLAGDANLHDDGRITYSKSPPVTDPLDFAGAVFVLETIQSGITVTGDTHFFVDINGGRHLLACGQAAGNGVVKHYFRASRSSSFSLLSSKSVSSSDFTGVVFRQSDGNLYVLDAASSTILSVAWNPSLSLSNVTLTTWVTAAEVSELSNAGSLRLDVNTSDEVSLFGASPSVLLNVPAGRPKHTAISKNASGAVASGNFEPDDTPAIGVVVDSQSVTELATTITVIGRAGVSYVIKRLDTSAVIGQGTIPVGASGQAIPTSAPLEIGVRYLACEVGVEISQFDGYAVECIRRSGFSEPLDATQNLSPIYLHSWLFPGASLLASARITNIDPQYTQTGLTIYPAFFATAISTVDRVGDPVVAAGSNLMIDPTVASIGATIAIVDKYTGDGFVQIGLPVPVSTDFIGLVVLLQFGIDVAGNLVLSEIGGSLVHANDPFGGGAALSAKSMSGFTRMTPRQKARLFTGSVDPVPSGWLQELIAKRRAKAKR